MISKPFITYYQSKLSRVSVNRKDYSLSLTNSPLQTKLTTINNYNETNFDTNIVQNFNVLAKIR